MKDQNISPEEFDRIEQYLNNTMNEKERSEFDKALSNNDALSQKFTELKILLQAVEEQSLRDKLNIFHEGIPSKGNKGLTVKLYKQFAVAASIIIMVGIGIWMIFGQKTQNEKLFAEFFTPDPGLVTPMGTSSNYEFYRGMVDYKQANYKLAIERWKVLLDQKPNNDTLHYYLGVSNLALGENDKAIEELSIASGITDSKFIDEAYYYLGLAYLNNNFLNDAKISFEKSKLEKSLQILKELE